MAYYNKYLIGSGAAMTEVAVPRLFREVGFAVIRARLHMSKNSSIVEAQVIELRSKKKMTKLYKFDL